MSTRLCELAEKYGSDKVPSIFHGYTPFYHELLKGREIKRVLEVGIGLVDEMTHVKNYTRGASLYMWRDYFPEAEIWGLDIKERALFQDERIVTEICDQSAEYSLQNFCDKQCGRGLHFDLIVDDGSHNYPHQALTANVFIPRLLSRSGLYIIEDVIQRKELFSALGPWPVEVKIFNLKRTPDDCVFYIEGSKL